MKHYTIVIKLGTSSLCDEKTRNHRIANMSLIVETAVALRKDGHQVIIVSSGGIAVGLKRLKMDRRPKHLPQVQAVAAIGQARLIGLWDDLFRQLDQPIAQILLTRNDIADRQQYLSAVNTMHELIHMGVIPIVNENDTLSAYEIKFGDNDTLSAITAGMVNADYLFLMTDVDCLYTDNPRSNPDAKPVLVVDDIDKLNVDVSSGAGSQVGTGGMTTKLIAAELATAAGVTTVICKSEIPGNIRSILGYIEQETLSHEERSKRHPEEKELTHYELGVNVPYHTRFIGRDHPIKDRKFWILHGRTPKGTIFIDKGASQAITRSNKAGLLPAGVRRVEGTFHTSECVHICIEGEEVPIGRAIVNYTSQELERIKGIQSTKIQDYLGYADTEYVAYRDNMSFHRSALAGLASGTATPTSAQGSPLVLGGEA